MGKARNASKWLKMKIKGKRLKIKEEKSSKLSRWN
jgi:hypothetical protein